MEISLKKKKKKEKQICPHIFAKQSTSLMRGRGAFQKLYVPWGETSKGKNTWLWACLSPSLCPPGGSQLPTGASWAPEFTSPAIGHFRPLQRLRPCRDSAPAETPPLQRLRPCRDSAPAETTPPLQRRLRPCRMTLGRTVHHTMGPAETPAHPPLQCCLAVLPGILPSPVGTRLSYPTTEGGEPACRKGGPWGARSRGDHRRQPASQPLV